MKKTLALLALASLLLPAAAVASAVVKSPLDSKHYRALELENGLKVLLVSDPATDKSAAALDVNIGSGSDPPDWPGLAHFLEHMLFLGTEKYPEAGEYKEFIAAHGGNDNAYTAFANTNYYFDISAEHLLPALDRFSRFFIDPTFDALYVDRERAVVHSEYQARRKDEARRMWAARRQLVNPQHPGSRFVVGSAHTLRDRDDASARRKLIEFYERYYSADVMTLAVVGRESLDQLERWVRRLFAEIPDRDAAPERFEQAYIDPQWIASRLNIVPQKDTQQLGFIFPIPSTEPYYRSKPLGYIANLVGHEGEGSLLALLQSLGWAEALSAGAGYMDEVHGTFEVSVQLTEPGLAHIGEIGALLFQYIGLIRGGGVETWRFEEQQKLAAIAFRFAEERRPGPASRWLAAAMHRYPPEDVLRGPYMMEDYRPELITELLARLTPGNVLLQVVDKNAHTGEKTPFYAVDFGIQPISQPTLALWEKAARGNGQPDSRLALPEPNRFIPERLTLEPLADAPAIPRTLEIRDGVAAWRRGDPQFGTPRAAFYFSVKSRLAADSPRNLVLTELYVRMVNEQLNRLGYPARLAGLGYELYRHGRGFSVRISGYADKQPLLLEALLAALLAPDFDAEKLELVKAGVKREWRNVFLETPSGQTVHELYRLLLHPYWSESERLAVLDEITPAHLAGHAARLLAEIRITSLSHGDVSRERSVAMNQTLAAAFAASRPAGEVARARVRMLDDNRDYLRNMDVDHNDSALAVYFQGRGKSRLERAKLLLLTQLIEPEFFHRMRTINRLGYLVHAAPLMILEVPGLLFSVQSPGHGPAQIGQLLEAFLADFDASLERMDAQEFAQVRRGLVARILTGDKKLTERTDRYWLEIDRREFTFDSRRRLAGLVDGLELADVRDYFRLITRERPRKLTVQSPGRRPAAAPLDGENYTTVRDAVEFRQNTQALFPAY